MQTQSYSSKPSDQASPVTTLQQWIVEQLADQLSLDASTIDVAEPLTRYGLDSIDAVTLVGDLEDWLDVELPSTLFWDHPTIAQSANFLVDNYELSALESGAAPVKEPLAAAQPTEKKGWGKLFG
ncbi:MAG: acyl carrier protein [Cyanobacteria bacterium P01_H01_bin.15]